MARLLWCMLWLMLQPLPLCAQSAPPLVLNTYAGPPFSTADQQGYYDQILREAFRRLGVPVVIGQLPAERSLLNANSGIDDGDFVRIAGLEKRYPNLVMVPEKIDDFEFVAFTRRLNLETARWSALAPYHVAIVRGWKILEENLAGVWQLSAVDNQEQLFTLLQRDRVDAVVYSRREGHALLWRLGITDGVTLEPPLAVRPMYLYLNKKHQALAVPLAAILKRMKADGTVAAIGRRTLTLFLPAEAPGAHR
ncbi:MAG: substrate-binding periplasmic protein [Thermodesulfobacteriota bacterium]